MKRANCLYRVSTKKQVSVVSEFGTLKDDIPMQKQACREFADSHGWVIVKEFEVKEEQEKDALEKFRPAFSRFKSWADEFDNATLEQKKMIAGQLFKRVEVGLHIVMNMTRNVYIRYLSYHISRIAHSTYCLSFSVCYKLKKSSGISIRGNLTKEITVVISVNLTGGGRLCGLFEIRNNIKSALLMFALPFGFLVRIGIVNAAAVIADRYRYY